MSNVNNENDTIKNNTPADFQDYLDRSDTGIYRKFFLPTPARQFVSGIEYVLDEIIPAVLKPDSKLTENADIDPTLKEIIKEIQGSDREELVRALELARAKYIVDTMDEFDAMLSDDARAELYDISAKTSAYEKDARPKWDQEMTGLDDLYAATENNFSSDETSETVEAAKMSEIDEDNI